MTAVTSKVTAAGGITGNGNVVVVDNTSDNTLITFRFKLPNVKMAAAEDAFDAEGRHFGPGAFVIANANRAQLEPVLKQLGLSGYALSSAPTVKTHDLDIPRIGYAHSWTRTQDEGWVRAALDTYGVPYTYFGENKLKEGNLRAKYDVILFPHGGSSVGGGGGGGFGGGGGGGGGAAPTDPVPYKSTKEFPSLGYPDSTDDVRGALGVEGLKALYEFVQQGGTLITEGSTASILPDLNLAPGVKTENPSGLFARGTILRGIIADAKSPLVYGYQRSEVPIYFSSGPVLNAGAAAAVAEAPAAGGRGGRGSSLTQNTTPMANPLRLSPWDPDKTGTAYGLATSKGNDFNVAQAGQAGGRGGRGGGGGRGGAAGGGGGGAATPTLNFSADPNASARVVMRFPEKAEDMLLSGTLEGGAALANRAQLIDEKIGTGHVVMFAIRPFWRWQTQGTFAMGFNAIVHWNDLDAGK
jgi:hypothetical protein